MIAETNQDFFHIIEEIEEIPPQRYGQPHTCRHCGCKLNSYHKYDSCYPCQEKGKFGFSREEINAKTIIMPITGEKKLKEILEILRRK